MTWIGFDVGGTFIDIVAWDGKSIMCHKVPSAKPGQLADHILAGIDELLSQMEGEPEVTVLAHGTTTATNTLIERDGARVGLLTTKGFRDVLEIGRMTRKDHFNIFVTKVPPLASRRLRGEVAERIAADGEVLQPLREEDVRAAVRRLLHEGADSIAVSFLNSYRNPVHERQAVDWIAEHFPDVTVSMSFDVSAEYGEFERTSTTVMNEYLRPRIVEYVRRLIEGFEARGIRTTLRVVQSNGGRIPAETAAKYPVRLLRSGPAAGVNGAKRCAENVSQSIIAFDMGGTSTDVSVVVDGKVSYQSEAEIDGYPIRVVMSDIRSIGAGGGSLVRVDRSGSLRVGPESAGADPGPMCYGRGGEVPTVTDANVVLGYINPDRFCGGDMVLDEGRSIYGIERDVANILGVSRPDAALGVAQVATVMMTGAVRTVTTELGRDVRDFVLTAFGGAGPLYAAFVAHDLGISKVLVPRLPGLLCAFGLLVSEFRADSWRTYPRLLADLAPEELGERIAELQADAADLLGGPVEMDVLYERRVELCYEGQRHELGVTLPDGPITSKTPGWLAKRLRDLFFDRYGFVPSDGRPQLVTLRVFATQPQAEQAALLAALEPSGDGEPCTAPPTPSGERLAYFPSSPGGVATALYDRNALPPGGEIHGPAIVEEDYSTVVVPPTHTLTRLPTGDLLMHDRHQKEFT